VIVIVIVIVDVIGPVVVAVHVHGNGPVIVIPTVDAQSCVTALRAQRVKRTVPPSRIENSRPRSADATTAMIG
jgi:hypothetical protein